MFDVKDFPKPNWPCDPYPQTYNLPLFVKKRECLAPKAICYIECLSSNPESKYSSTLIDKFNNTFFGCGQSYFPPVPNWPNVPSPNAYISSSDVIIIVW